MRVVDNIVGAVVDAAEWSAFPADLAVTAAMDIVLGKRNRHPNSDLEAQLTIALDEPAAAGTNYRQTGQGLLDQFAGLMDRWPRTTALALAGASTIILGSTGGQNSAQKTRYSLPATIPASALGRMERKVPKKLKLTTKKKYKKQKVVRSDTPRTRRYIRTRKTRSMMMKPSRSILLRNKRAKRRAAFKRKIQKIARFINTKSEY